MRATPVTGAIAHSMLGTTRSTMAARIRSTRGLSIRHRITSAIRQ
jgi:hypothetical protein